MPERAWGFKSPLGHHNTHFTALRLARGHITGHKQCAFVRAWGRPSQSSYRPWGTWIVCSSLLEVSGDGVPE